MTENYSNTMFCYTKTDASVDTRYFRTESRGTFTLGSFQANINTLAAGWIKAKVAGTYFVLGGTPLSSLWSATVKTVAAGGYIYDHSNEGSNYVEIIVIKLS